MKIREQLTSIEYVSRFGFALLFVWFFQQSAFAAVQNSKHDLSGQTANTDAVCVFCHTPHGANVTFDGAPLWNKVTDATGFTRYSTLNTSTLDGAEAPVGSVSLACLSCHDGTQAMDVVVNVPGTGGHSATGTQIDAANIGNMPGTGPIPNLTKDLRDDHPISIQYGGGGCSNNDPACTNMGDADFNTPDTAVINNIQQWWVDTGTAGRQKTDIILYTRADEITTGTIEPFVECGSCHDPHNAESDQVAGQVQFLRIDNTGSAICLACHNK
jgi:predicted CXXCH cytochrome family protein